MISRARLVLVGFWLITPPRRAPAQSGQLPLSHWQHTEWTGKNGPPPQSADGMYRSNDGYLWLGARNGVVRFDGTGFTMFDSTNVPALKGVTGCCYVVEQVGPSGTMWVVGPHGLLLGYRDGRFRVELREGSGLSGSVTEDRLGRLWGSTNRLRIIRNGRFEAPPLPAGVPDTGIIGIEPDSGKGIWIGTRQTGLWHVNGDSVEHVGAGWLRAELQSSDGALWTVGTREPYLGVQRIRNGVASQVRLPDGSGRPVARSIVEGPDGSIWLPTNVNGVLRWRDGVMEQFSAANGLSSDNVDYLYASPEGAVWVATDGGLDRLRPGELAYVDPSIALPLTPFVLDQRGAIWLSGADRPLRRLSGGLVHQQPGAVVVDSGPISVHGPYDVVAPSRAGGVWLAPFGGGLVYFNGRNSRSFGRADGFPAERIQAGFEGSDGTVWVKVFGGELGEIHDGRYRRVPLPGSDWHGPFVEDGRGRLWIASADSGALVMVSHDSIRAEVRLPGAGAMNALALAVEGGDTLWAATEAALYRIIGDRATEVHRAGIDHLFASNVAIGISRGQLWFASALGISRVPLGELNRVADGRAGPITPVSFDALDGIPTPRTGAILRNTLEVGPDGRVWIATLGGLAVANGPREPYNPVPPRVFVDGATLGGRPIPLAEGATLPVHPRKLGIRFTVPDLGLPERARVEYRLDGADTSWVNAVAPYLATYDQLKPGRYRFRARAWNEAGLSSLAETTLSFRVPAGWEESWWFRLLCVLGVAALGAAGAIAFHRGQTRRTVAVAEARFDAMLAERTRLARELHDTLLQGFTGITLQLDGVRDSLAATSAPYAEDLARILERADRTLREAREMVWDMRQPGLIDADLGEALASASAALPNPDGIAIEHVVTGTPRALSPNVSTTMLRIGKEAIVNALNHSKAHTIVVTLDYESHHVRLEVRDDGCGARPEQLEAVATARGHWGAAGMRERARAAGGAITFDTTPGWGTRVTVSLPAEPLT